MLSLLLVDSFYTPGHGIRVSTKKQRYLYIMTVDVWDAEAAQIICLSVRRRTISRYEMSASVHSGHIRKYSLKLNSERVRNASLVAVLLGASN
jgi:hypothetical protein